MEQVDRGAFADTRNALFLIRLLNTLQQLRQNSPVLDSLIEEEEQRNGYHASVPLINQASFLQLAYMTLVRTREAYFKGAEAQQVLERAVGSLVSKVTFDGNRPERTGVKLVWWLRNALAHARVQVTEDEFVLTDMNDKTSVTMTMPWAVLGEICEAVI